MKRPMLRTGLHPSRRVLAAWLEGSIGVRRGPRITAHLDNCDRCADRIATLAAGSSAEDDLDWIGGALRELYDPPTGLGSAVVAAADERAAATEQLETLTGLFALPGDVLNLLGSPDHSPTEPLQLPRTPPS